MTSTTLDILDYLHNGTLVSFLVQNVEAIRLLKHCIFLQTLLCVCLTELTALAGCPQYLSRRNSI